MRQGSRVIYSGAAPLEPPAPTLYTSSVTSV